MLTSRDSRSSGYACSPPTTTPHHPQIVATIGPVSEDAVTLPKVVTEGMRVMRINFSHATFEEAEMRMTNLAASVGFDQVRCGARAARCACGSVWCAMV